MAKQKIAVVGGGVGAITAVYAITQTPGWSDKYDITIHQLGWRLGGKGASGRNQAMNDRIQEHGLHVWAGFYENAFRNMRSCYEELVSLGLRDKDAPLGTIETAFSPLSHLFLAESVDMPDGTSQWRPWLIDLPANDEVPGTGTSVDTVFEMFLRMLEILGTFLIDGELSQKALEELGEDEAKRLTGVYKAVSGAAFGMPRNPFSHSSRSSGVLADLIGDAQTVVHELQTPENRQKDATRRVLYLLDLSLAFARGMVTSDAFCSGYNVLDQWEFSEWLKGNGAGEYALKSSLVRGCYDFVFGFPLGQTAVANVGAGTAIRSMSRLMLTYKGAIFQKMNAGMGDTIFGPYYEVLKAKGVKFEFFSAATHLALAEDNVSVAELHMVRQAIPKSGSYNPLIPVQDLQCWPSEPLWDQLEDGDALQSSGVNFESEAHTPTGTPFVLKKGTDFDVVLLGASLGSLPYLTHELAAVSPRWQRMLDSVKTVGTQAAQFWMKKTADDLGWRTLVEEHNAAKSIPPSPLRTVITGFAEPLDTWADMTALLPRESWPEDGPVSIAYFCSPSADGTTVDQFKDTTRAWMSESLTDLWPDAKGSDGTFDDDDVLYKSPDFDGSAFDAQYYRVNMYGSERYVLSVKNSVYKRLEPSDSGFANLILAGDWTRCGLNAGCVEAATMSGLAAANAITGANLPIVGSDDLETGEVTADKAMFATKSVTSARWPLSGFYARGQMTGVFIMYAMPRDQVQALLPSGLTLGHTDLVAPGMHPVGMSFAEYRHVVGSFVPRLLEMSPYVEAACSIPFVRCEESGRASLLYPRRLYVNNNTAKRAGLFWYAMNKEYATGSFDDRRFTIQGPGGGNIIEADYEQRMVARPFRTFSSFSAVSEILNQACVTKKKDGQFLYNFFDMELAQAYAVPVTAQVEVNDPNSGGFPRLETRNFDPMRAGEPERLPGAFRVWSSWSLTNPLDSARVRKAAEAEAFVRGLY